MDKNTFRDREIPQHSNVVVVMQVWIAGKLEPSRQPENAISS